MINVKEADKNVKDLNIEIASLTRQNQLQTEINLHQSNYNAKSEKIEEIRQQHEEGLKLILEKDEIPREKLRTSVEKAQQKFVILQFFFTQWYTKNTCKFKQFKLNLFSYRIAQKEV